MMQETAFTRALREAMECSKMRAKRDGVTSMSIDNWMAITRPPSVIAGALRGTNAPYYYKQLFCELAAGDSFAYRGGEA